MQRKLVENRAVRAIQYFGVISAKKEVLSAAINSHSSPTLFAEIFNWSRNCRIIRRKITC